MSPLLKSVKSLNYFPGTLPPPLSWACDISLPTKLSKCQLLAYRYFVKSEISRFTFGFIWWRAVWAARLRSPILSYPKTVFMSMYRAEHRQGNKAVLGVWQCHWLSAEIYGFEKLGSHHQLLIWDRKDSGRYHHKIPASHCFFPLSFCLMPKFPMIGNQRDESRRDQ